MHTLEKSAQIFPIAVCTFFFDFH